MNLILQAIKALLRGLEMKIPKRLSELVNDLKFPTPDWNQNDPKAEGYIANRPFYEESMDVIRADEQTITIDETGRAQIAINDVMWPLVGTPFTVVFDGTPYKGTVYEDSDMCTRTDFVTKDGIDVYIYDGISLVTSPDLGGEHTISVTWQITETHKIAEKFIPDAAVKSVNGQIGHVRLTASDVGAASSSDVRSKMNIDNPSGTGSFSLWRKGGTTVGKQSVAMGQNATASGITSMAVGDNPTASGDFSVAIGSLARAAGKYSVAIGHETSAEYTNQFVCGVRNVPSDATFIVGIGTPGYYGTNENGFTVSRDGVAWSQGRPQFGGNAQDDGAQTVMANGDKEIILASSTEGSTKKFKISVDDSGAITATEVTE